MQPHNYAAYHNSRRRDFAWAVVIVLFSLLLLYVYVTWVSSSIRHNSKTTQASVPKMERDPLDDLFFGQGLPIMQMVSTVAGHIAVVLVREMNKSKVKAGRLSEVKLDDIDFDDKDIQEDIANLGMDYEQIGEGVEQIGRAFGERVLRGVRASVREEFNRRVTQKSGKQFGGGGSGKNFGGGFSDNVLLVGHSGVVSNQHLTSLISTAFNIPFLVINCAYWKSSNQSLDDLFLAEVRQKWHPFHGICLLPPMFVLLDGIDHLNGEIELQKDLVNFISRKQNEFSKTESHSLNSSSDTFFFASVPFNSSFPSVSEKRSCTKAEKSAEFGDSQCAMSQDIDDDYEIKRATKHSENGSRLVKGGDEILNDGIRPNAKINAPSYAEGDAQKSHDSQNDQLKSHKLPHVPEPCHDAFGELPSQDTDRTKSEQMLIPELLSAFPNVISFATLNETDLKRVLTEPKVSLLARYQTLFSSVDAKLSFTASAVSAITAIHLNDRARDLHSILESVLEKPLSDVALWRNISTVIITADVVVGAADPMYIFEN